MQVEKNPALGSQLCLKLCKSCFRHYTLGFLCLALYRKPVINSISSFAAFFPGSKQVSIDRWVDREILPVAPQDRVGFEPAICEPPYASYYSRSTHSTTCVLIKIKVGQGLAPGSWWIFADLSLSPSLKWSLKQIRRQPNPSGLCASLLFGWQPWRQAIWIHIESTLNQGYSMWIQNCRQSGFSELLQPVLIFV